MDITFRPIDLNEIDRVPLRCWPERQAIMNLFTTQGTIGMAAWDGEQCVAQLHCYRIERPDDIPLIWPKWNLPWWAEMLLRGEVQLKFPAWCHACCHVGRTLETVHQEFLALVLRFAEQTKWNVDLLHKKLGSLDGVFVTMDEVVEAIRELQNSTCRSFRTEAPEYRGCGIGTSLCIESVRWARDHAYAAVVTGGVPKGISEAMDNAGALPWTTYARLGFQPYLLQIVDTGHPPVHLAKESILKNGGTNEDICDRMMVLELNKQA